MQNSRKYDNTTLLIIRKTATNQQPQSDLNPNIKIILKSLKIYQETWKLIQRTRYKSYREYRSKIPLCTSTNNRKRKRTINSQQNRRVESISRRCKTRHHVFNRDQVQQQQQTTHYIHN
jgi:hypothetical protein